MPKQQPPENEYGPLTEEEKEKIQGWEDLAKIVGRQTKDEIKQFVKEKLDEFRRIGGPKHESEK